MPDLATRPRVQQARLPDHHRCGRASAGVQPEPADVDLQQVVRPVPLRDGARAEVAAGALRRPPGQSVAQVEAGRGAVHPRPRLSRLHLPGDTAAGRHRHLQRRLPLDLVPAGPELRRRGGEMGHGERAIGELVFVEVVAAAAPGEEEEGEQRARQCESVENHRRLRVRASVRSCVGALRVLLPNGAKVFPALARRRAGSPAACVCGYARSRWRRGRPRLSCHP